LPLDGALRVYSGTLVEFSVRTQVDRVTLGLRGARGMLPCIVALDIRFTQRRNGG
jgi:hypothetical protein